MKKLKIIILLFPILAGCHAQYTTNGEQQYLKSRNGIGLVVPPPLSTTNMSHFYDLPPQDQDSHVSIKPEV